MCARSASHRVVLVSRGSVRTRQLVGETKVRTTVKIGRRSFLIALVATVPLACLGTASSALAKAPTGDFAVFSQCPRFTAGVELCLFSQVTGGEVILNKQAVPIEKTITLQGGLIVNEETGQETFVGAINGDTLSKTPQKVPGGLLGLVKCNEIKGIGLLEIAARVACELTFENAATGVNAITELAKPASSITISKKALLIEEGTVLGLPVKIRLENAFLGSECYIGSSTNPVQLNLTTGTTAPNPPNVPIRGKSGEITFKDEFEFVEIPGNTLVNNEFSAPAATGCGGIFSILVNPLVNSKIGLPSADGKNTVIQNADLKEATTIGVINSEK